MNHTTSIKERYDERARILKENHPLGIQVCLDSGVANGVLVVRTVEECVALIRRIILNELEFTVNCDEKEGDRYLFLRETVSGCVFRLMTGDKMLTNAFWNFYLD